MVEQFLIDCTRDLLAITAERQGEASFFLHDPLAIGVVIDPSFVTSEAMYVAIETQGDISTGMTIADRRLIKPELKNPPNAEVCTGVDAPRFRAFFLKRLTGE